MSRLRNKSAMLRRAACAAAVISLGSATGAQAATEVATLAAAAAVCGGDAGDLAVQPAAPAIVLEAQSSKSAAILGGQPSALEQIRLAQQAEEAAASTAATGLAGAEPASTQSLAPAVGGSRFQAAECVTMALPAAGLGADDFLASRRLTIGRTAFDRDWRRVSSDRISTRRYSRLVGEAPGGGFAALRAVNGWVNRAITFTEDRDLFARADYWAGAAATLKLRRGDCEDIALTKMQLLAAAGIPREDMVLTIARDLVRNADHAVLIVRHDGRYYMLDNASDEVFDASSSHDYRPILSFGSSQTWLHGY